MMIELRSFDRKRMIFACCGNGRDAGLLAFFCFVLFSLKKGRVALEILPTASDDDDDDGKRNLLSLF